MDKNLSIYYFNHISHILLFSDASQTDSQNVKPRSRHLSTPSNLETTHAPPQSAPMMRSLSSDAESVHKMPSSTDVCPSTKPTLTPPPGFSARNPPPGFSARSPPLGFGSDSTLPTGLTAKITPPDIRKQVVKSSPPPRFGGQAKSTLPPPGFEHKTPTKSKKTGTAESAGFKVNFQATSPVLLPQDQTLAQKDTTSPAATESKQKSPVTSPDAGNQGNSTVVRFARQQIRPYSTQKDPAAVPSATKASPEKVKRTLASAKKELEAIKKIHLNTTNSIPPHVKKLEATLARIGAKYHMEGSTSEDVEETGKAVVDKNHNISQDGKTATSPKVNENNRNNNAVDDSIPATLNRNNNTADDGIPVTPNRNNNAQEDDEVGTPDKVKKMTWRAISVNHSLLFSGIPQQFSFGVHAICDVLKTHGKEQEEYNKGEKMAYCIDRATRWILTKSPHYDGINL